MGRLVTLEGAWRLSRGGRDDVGGRRVLIVEDDNDFLSSVAEAIRDEGYEALTAGNGWQALSLLEQQRGVALVLVDLFMPEMSGWQLIDEMRDRWPSVPIILISAAENLREEAERLGVQGYLAKPFRLDDIIRVTNEYCSR
jgi:CheY-like chemotaxis protein